DGAPLLPLCQLNISELPYRPGNLADITLITVFMDSERLPSNTPNGDGWLLRTYNTLDNLIPLKMPAYHGRIKPFPIRWEYVEADYPCWEDVSLAVPPAIDEKYYDLFHNEHCTKVGGWPSLIQHRISWSSGSRHLTGIDYVFQINTEAKAHWAWADSGMGYFGRGTGDLRDAWRLSWQSY